MNALNNFDKIDREYNVAHTDDLVRFRRPEAKDQGHSSRAGGEGIHVDAVASTGWLNQSGTNLRFLL